MHLNIALFFVVLCRSLYVCYGAFYIVDISPLALFFDKKMQPRIEKEQNTATGL